MGSNDDSIVDWPDSGVRHFGGKLGSRETVLGFAVEFVVGSAALGAGDLHRAASAQSITLLPTCQPKPFASRVHQLAAIQCRRAPYVGHVTHVDGICSVILGGGLVL